MTEAQIREMIHDRLAVLGPLVVEYVELVEAERVLTERFGGLPVLVPETMRNGHVVRAHYRRRAPAPV